MALQNYLAQYQSKRLNEVVIPGAHDAGIYTKNKSNVKTQSLNITDQAWSGCRFFDLRIACHKRRALTRHGIKTVYENRAYHLDGSLVIGKKSRSQAVGHAGGWGDSLEKMLGMAKAFVHANKTEFLILKFSKCYNWQDVAQTCQTILGTYQYKGDGNLNNKTVSEFKGSVITAFDDEARPKLNAAGNGTDGIVFIKALYDKDSGKSTGYDGQYDGLQYFGKFSSTDSVKKNTEKQQATLATGADTHMDALGMMYWTTTGLLGDIEKRNKKMWTATNRASLQKTWAQGLQASIESRMEREFSDVARLAYGRGGYLGGRMKSFMPNIIMMDFVSTDKCKTVKDMNDVAGTELAKLYLPPAPLPRGYTE